MSSMACLVLCHACEGKSLRFCFWGMTCANHPLRASMYAALVEHSITASRHLANPVRRLKSAITVQKQKQKQKQQLRGRPTPSRMRHRDTPGRLHRIVAPQNNRPTSSTTAGRHVEEGWMDMWLPSCRSNISRVYSTQYTDQHVRVPSTVVA